MKKNKNKEFSFKDTPPEVVMVWVIQWNKQPIGESMYNKIQEIIDKYPEYFKWEHQYKAIPQHIHDAFLKECYPERFEPIADKFVSNGKGLIDEIKQYEPAKFPSTEKEFIKMFEDWQKSTDEQQLKRADYENRVRKIWNKHYSKFGLECREF